MIDIFNFFFSNSVTVYATVVLLFLTTAQLVKTMTGVGIFTISADFLGYLSKNLFSFLRKRSGKNHEKNKTKFTKMTLQEKRDSFGYKYYTVLNEIILDLGYRQKNITVEGFSLGIKVLAFFFAFLFYLVTKNLFLFVILWIIANYTIVAVIFSASKFKHINRKIMLMDAEDYISSSMRQGLVIAVEDNLKNIDKTIRPSFTRFLDEVYNRNIDMDTAIDNLNLNCGEKLDDFCDKAKIYEKERRPGMERQFEYNIKRNAFERALDRKCAKTFGQMNKIFFICLGLVTGFLAFSIAQYGPIAKFYFNGIGRYILCGYIVLVVIAFIYTQLQQAKPFGYGK